MPRDTVRIACLVQAPLPVLLCLGRCLQPPKCLCLLQETWAGILLHHVCHRKPIVLPLVQKLCNDPRAALQKDNQGNLPIHVAAVSGASCIALEE